MSATARLQHTGRLSPLERLEALCDPGSLQVIRTRVVSTASLEGSLPWLE